MRIKTFKLFESSSEDYFPSLEEVKDYFYDFTDELDININYFRSGYKYFLKPHRVGDYLGDNFEKILKDKSNYIDILNTELSITTLLICSNNATVESISGERELGSDLAIEAIKDGSKAYNHIMFQFSDSSFREEHLPKLIECLKRFYHETNFRPYGEIWTEERPVRYGVIDQDSGIETGDEIVLLYGFSGLFVDCSDEEYRKLCEIYIKDRKNNILITKHFI
jgi:hypothetical protein